MVIAVKAQVVYDKTNFPDPNFRAALIEQIWLIYYTHNSDGDCISHSRDIREGDVLYNDGFYDDRGHFHEGRNYMWRQTVISRNTEYFSFNIYGKSITNLTGVEHFTGLESLWCDGNQLTSLDVSKNTWLKRLWCNGNPLTSLDVSKNTALKELHCGGNQLTSLDVSKNTALVDLDCSGTQLTSLDVSKNTALIWQRCTNNNQLTSLDVSGCTALTELICYFNQLTSLDVSKNTALTSLYCYFNQLTSLDVSKNIALTHLRCYNNQLTSLDVSGCTALEYLFCESNQLTSLDVSKNTKLTDLSCGSNQLTSLYVSKNTSLTSLDCEKNQLSSLDVSKNTALWQLACYNNQLTSLDVSKNTALTLLRCYGNKIKGEAMDALVNSLPTVKKGEFYVIDTKDANEGNVCTKAQVAVAKAKGWTVYDYFGGGTYDEETWSYVYPEYEGSDDPVVDEEELEPVDEDDEVTYASVIEKYEDLNGKVIGNIYYNISDDNGGYDPDEGCIVVKKPTDDGTMGDLEGKDIFGEDFKSQFTGIVFKVPAGKGTIKVNAETTGNMLLKVKVGSGDPVEMELNGKLKVTFPYNVSEPTYVYIYAGAASEAKGLGTPNASEDAALKIYGIEFIRDNTPTGIDNGQFTIDNSDDAWYSLDGKKLNGEPKEKGVYIRNGRKVVK